MRELDKEQINLLVILFSKLRREYEEFRKGCHIMESPTQYNARRIEDDLVARGYKLGESNDSI